MANLKTIIIKEEDFDSKTITINDEDFYLSSATTPSEQIDDFMLKLYREVLPKGLNEYWEEQIMELKILRRILRRG